ncbi:uncharacterized protein LY79DRAFT_131898 [Colletotrichum navitas]|uniref:Uncharacterized protein n=1 Tax=Colletotrichum navitas TaxID=681940 RepID=A0AAD8Q2Y6_9PEZI|nr:uncharacterized protein LY79DRAFT_131898 [Colletotrichum navitas]KAK1594538.1 hypothetical protein LY79DRAFT_131898 [Colletotrichum navitas]
MKVLHIRYTTRTTTVCCRLTGTAFLRVRSGQGFASIQAKPSPSSFCHGKNRSVPTEYCLGTYTHCITLVQRTPYSVDNDDGPVWTQCMHVHTSTRPRIACCHSFHPSTVVIVIIAFIMLSCISQLPVADPPTQQMRYMISQPANLTAGGRLSLLRGLRPP